MHWPTRWPPQTVMGQLGLGEVALTAPRPLQALPPTGMDAPSASETISHIDHID